MAVYIVVNNESYRAVSVDDCIIFLKNFTNSLLKLLRKVIIFVKQILNKRGWSGALYKRLVVICICNSSNRILILEC